MKYVHWVVSVCLFTASWDLIAVVHIGGSLRLTQILMFLVCAAAMGRVVQTGRILWPRGGTALSLWMLGQVLLLNLSGNLTLAVELFVLLVFAVVGAFAFLQLYGDSDMLPRLMKVYLASFVFIAAWGIMQLLSSALGGPAILVAQWIIHGRFPRINALSYEPSYFATYILIGWIMLVDLRLSRARLTQGRGWKWATLCVSAALFLCTSKTGWALMILEGIFRFAPRLWSSLRHRARLFRRGDWLIPIPSGGRVVVTVLSLVVVTAALTALFTVVKPLTFLSGTGIGGTASHSVDARSGAVADTWEVFLEHPWFGPSLGGVPVEIAAHKGVTITDVDGLRLYWGSPVIVDILTASGIFFFIPFLMFLYTNTFGALRLARRNIHDERGKWLQALARAMIYEWIMLLSEQNLVRVYLWYHFAMVIVVAYHLEFVPAPAFSAAWSNLRRRALPSTLEAATSGPASIAPTGA